MDSRRPGLGTRPPHRAAPGRLGRPPLAVQESQVLQLGWLHAEDAGGLYGRSENDLAEQLLALPWKLGVPQLPTLPS